MLIRIDCGHFNNLFIATQCEQSLAWAYLLQTYLWPNLYISKLSFGTDKIKVGPTVDNKRTIGMKKSLNVNTSFKFLILIYI